MKTSLKKAMICFLKRLPRISYLTQKGYLSGGVWHGGCPGGFCPGFMSSGLCSDTLQNKLWHNLSNLTLTIILSYLLFQTLAHSLSTD